MAPMSRVGQSAVAHRAEVLDLVDHGADHELGQKKEALSVADDASCCH